ncbi:MAG TPA: HNH endonuclease signature motif containing protein [Gemmatimonadaceae bacterium]|nr:HNH endonuclease signature motif containing protein [Gemmatimonadaceae bacterium]
MKPSDRKPIEFRQLCMVVKTILQRNPGMDDAEWKAKAQDTLAVMGFLPPDPPDQLGRAMTQVEEALRRTLGPRPARLVPYPPTAPPQVKAIDPPVSKARTHRPEGWDLVVRLMAKLSDGYASAPSLPKPEPRREIVEITEESALDEFWRASCRENADRLPLLQAFAEIAILRPAGWDYAGIRAEAGDHLLHAFECFVCHGERNRAWHHVIQIQHGGSNYLRNRVSLCASCHAAIHPWLVGAPPTGRTTQGWSQFSDVAGAVCAHLSVKRTA